MTVIQALFLGLVQGLTEFLPVSSSGHLVIFQHFFGIDQPELLFDMLLHVGTLSAVLIFFRKRLLALNRQQFELVIFGTLPLVLIYFFVKPYLDQLFSSLLLVGIGYLFTASVLFLSKKIDPSKKLELSQVSYKQAFIIGLWQMIAIVPGISRSGSTVAGGLFQGVKRQDAFYFSFLLSIPAVSGATLMEFLDSSNLAAVTSAPYIAGFVGAILSGLLALKLLALVINQAKLHLFGFYCAFLGGALIIHQLFS